MKNTKNEWMKLMMLVMEYFQLQNELTKLKIEEFSEWVPPSLECDECFAKAVEEAAQTVEEANMNLTTSSRGTGHDGQLETQPDRTLVVQRKTRRAARPLLWRPDH